MGFSYHLLLCVLCVNFVAGENAFKAAVISDNEFSTFSSAIQEAAKTNADIIVLPPSKVSQDGSFTGLNDYDEVTKSISAAAQQARLYVVASLVERTSFQERDQLIRSNLVYDRQGALVAVYRKPLTNTRNCTSTDIPSFTTDFGVTFGVLMEEDLVLNKPGDLKLKNYVVAGAAVQSEIPFLSGPQLSSAWSYVTNVNLITSYGVYAGKAGLKTSSEKIAVVQLNKDGEKDNLESMSTPTSQDKFSNEDLSQYIIRPLDLQASIRGYSQTVCHGKFCCDFYAKTRYVGSSHHEVSYGLAAFDGIRHFTGDHHIGAQSCAIVACAGLYKRSCALGPNNSTNTFFEKITIRGHFTKKNSAQFPIVFSTSESQNTNFEVQNGGNYNNVTITINNTKDVLHFGIFGRDYSRDFEAKQNGAKNEATENYYDYFFNEDVSELFDYLWIRLRVLIFIVSIYVLEMM